MIKYIICRSLSKSFSFAGSTISNKKEREEVTRLIDITGEKWRREKDRTIGTLINRKIEKDREKNEDIEDKINFHGLPLLQNFSLTRTQILCVLWLLYHAFSSPPPSPLLYVLHHYNSPFPSLSNSITHQPYPSDYSSS